MKKLLHLTICIFAAGTLVAQSIPNGGFESWTPRIWMDPVGYFTSNSQNVPNGFSANVIQTATAYHGSYAVQLTTIKVGKDTLSAYIANGNPTSFPAPGGIPYAQKPTGIRVYYKCNIMATDTAYIIAIFKKSGAEIGAYAYPLTGTVASYTLLTKTFAPALPVTPDTVVFAATPSRIIYTNYPGVPGSTLTIDSVTFTSVPSQPAMLNGDFENWQTDTANYPTGWSGNYPGVYQAKGALNVHAGNFALELKTAGPSPQNSSAQPGYASTGSGSNFGGGGYPYTLQKDTLTFYYEYVPQGTDSASVSLEFKKNGIVNATPSTYILPSASYTLMSLPFALGSAPDSVVVSFASSQTYKNAGMHVGSKLLVDNVSFKSAPFGLPELSEQGSVKVYPNPVKNTIYINTTGFSGQVQKLAVYDMSGRLIESMNYSSGFGNTVKDIDMSNYATGLYLLNVITTKGNYYKKISKE